MTATATWSGHGPVTAARHLRAVLLLPFMNTVIIPSVLLLIFRDARLLSAASTLAAVFAVMGLALLAAGIALAVRAITLFIRRGRGTLAPWDPTQVLITGDIYRYSRNPMKAGLFLILLGEVALLRSPALGAWALLFIVANTIYIRAFEEPGLRRRFGDEYVRYCRQAPRWLGIVSEEVA